MVLRLGIHGMFLECQCFVSHVPLSPWLKSMYKTYTGKDRRRVAMKKIQLVRKYTAADGTRRVS